MMPRVFCGTFEAETYWREADLAKLPALPDRNSSRIVEAMDEMLFAFCDPGDTVLTAKCMNDAHADYLHAIGFQFNRNRFDLSPPDDKGSVRETEIAPTIFQRMVEEHVTERLAVGLSSRRTAGAVCGTPGHRRSGRAVWTERGISVARCHPHSEHEGLFAANARPARNRECGHHSRRRGVAVGKRIGAPAAWTNSRKGRLWSIR